jgi:hypothetical protein
VPIATRPCLLGCALVVALGLSACGGGTGSAELQTAAQVAEQAGSPAPRTASPAAGKMCQGQVGGFLGSMDSLRRRLAVGVSYDQYLNEVEGVRSSYGRIPVDRLPFGCLTIAATPGEQGFNQYIEAANEWGGCVGEAGCEAATIEPLLQRRWRLASHFLSEAHKGLRELGAG